MVGGGCLYAVILASLWWSLWWRSSCISFLSAEIMGVHHPGQLQRWAPTRVSLALQRDLYVQLQSQPPETATASFQPGLSPFTDFVSLSDPREGTLWSPENQSHCAALLSLERSTKKHQAWGHGLSLPAQVSSWPATLPRRQAGGDTWVNPKPKLGQLVCTFQAGLKMDPQGWADAGDRFPRLSCAPELSVASL